MLRSIVEVTIKPVLKSFQNSIINLLRGSLYKNQEVKNTIAIVFTSYPRPTIIVYLSVIWDLKKILESV